VLGRLVAPDHVVELDDPSGPFADMGKGEHGEQGCSVAERAETRNSDLARLSLLGRAEDLLARLDRVTPADGDEMRSLYLERGWAEAVRHFAGGGMLNPAGLAEAGLLLAARTEWVDGLASDNLGSLAG
jgi:hypothetical protein